MGTQLTLYYFPSCPFCQKVLKAQQQLGITIEFRDIKKHEEFRQQLLKGGGKIQVPCLRIEKPSVPVQWLYESNDIINFLTNQVKN